MSSAGKNKRCGVRERKRIEISHREFMEGLRLAESEINERHGIADTQVSKPQFAKTSGGLSPSVRRRKKIKSHSWKVAFLKKLERSGSIKRACRTAKIPRATFDACMTRGRDMHASHAELAATFPGLVRIALGKWLWRKVARATVTKKNTAILIQKRHAIALKFYIESITQSEK